MDFGVFMGMTGTTNERPTPVGRKVWPTSTQLKSNQIEEVVVFHS